MTLKTIVIKYGGKVLENKTAKVKLIKEIFSLAKKFHIVIVHGGGKQINKALSKQKLKTEFVNGLRYTDKNTLKIVEKVLYELNEQITEELKYYGINAVGMSGKDYKTITASRIKNLGYVGKVKKINLRQVKILLDDNFIPVICPIASDSKGTTLNINADTVATELAIALSAKRLIFLTDVPGIVNRTGKIIHSVMAEEINELIKDKIVSAGMIPKLLGCQKAINRGVKKIYITDGKTGLKNPSGTVIEK